MKKSRGSSFLGWRKREADIELISGGLGLVDAKGVYSSIEIVGRVKGAALWLMDFGAGSPTRAN